MNSQHSNMKISANKRMYQSYNSQSSLDTANESPVIVFDSQNPKRINNLASPSGCPSRLVLKKNRPNNSSNVVLNGNNLAQQQHPERIPMKSSHIRFQSSQHSDLSINNFFETSSHPQKNKVSNLKYAASSAAPSECFLDTSADEQVQYSENNGDISNAPQFKKASSVIQNSSQLDSSIISDDNDEFNVWDNSSAQQIGIDVAGEKVKVPLEFIELFYVRSQLYQKDKVAKPDVLEEVQVISKMCNKPMSMIRSSNLVDNIEKNYLLSMKKNAKDVQQLSFDSKTSQNFHHSDNNICKNQIPHTNSQVSLPKNTPKAFRISQYNPFQSPSSCSNINPMSSTQSHSKFAPFKAVSSKELDMPASIFQHPPALNKNSNPQRNLFRFASNDAISMASTHHINLPASSVKSRDSPASRNNFPKNSNEQVQQMQQSTASLQQSPFVRVKKVSIRLSDKNNVHTPSKYAASKVAIDKIMKVTSQTAIQSSKKLFPQSHFQQDGLRA